MKWKRFVTTNKLSQVVGPSSPYVFIRASKLGAIYNKN